MPAAFAVGRVDLNFYYGAYVHELFYCGQAVIQDRSGFPELDLACFSKGWQ